MIIQKNLKNQTFGVINLIYKIIWPKDYDEYSWEYEAKGYICLEIEIYYKKIIHVNLYDNARFSQDSQDEVNNIGFFCEENIIIVKSINKKCIEDSLKKIFSGKYIPLLL